MRRPGRFNFTPPLHPPPPSPSPPPSPPLLDFSIHQLSRCRCRYSPFLEHLSTCVLSLPLILSLVYPPAFNFSPFHLLATPSFSPSLSPYLPSLPLPRPLLCKPILDSVATASPKPLHSSAHTYSMIRPDSSIFQHTTAYYTVLPFSPNPVTINSPQSHIQ